MGVKVKAIKKDFRGGKVKFKLKIELEAEAESEEKLRQNIMEPMLVFGQGKMTKEEFWNRWKRERICDYEWYGLFLTGDDIQIEEII